MNAEMPSITARCPNCGATEVISFGFGLPVAPVCACGEQMYLDNSTVDYGVFELETE
jgi:uncharacterized protein (DUF983 family)